MAISISDLRVGQTAVVRVMEPAYLVLSNSKKGTLFLKPDFTTELFEDGGYATKVGQRTEAVLNTKSNVIHMTLNGQPVCGSRHGQNTITVGLDQVNCQRCKEICKQ